MIEISNLTKHYPTEQVLNDVTLQMPDNHIYFLMGRNGSGKTTFIKCLLDLERYVGNISFSGNNFYRIRSEVFSIFDDIPIYSDLNGYQNIWIMLEELVPFEKSKIINLGLLSDKKLKEVAKNYSLGERKKLALAAAILRKPRYLVIDEISNGLDIETMEILQERLLELKLNSIIIATGHHFEFYESIADKLLVLRDKNIVYVEQYMKGDERLYEIYKQYISHD